MNKEAVILLSGGLDSVVSLAKAKQDNYEIKLALFFNYGQKAYQYEKIAAGNICNYYNLKLKIIDLQWLKDITATSLVNNDISIPKTDINNLSDRNFLLNSMKNVWIPNRNALFLNIAAAYCDSYNYSHIIIGANKEEAETFKDNSQQFIDYANKLLSSSTLVSPTAIAPLINLDKQAIIRLGNELNIPFNYIRSCYSDTEKHCGVCESCVRLKRGLESLGLFDILNMLFVE